MDLISEGNDFTRKKFLQWENITYCKWEKSKSIRLKKKKKKKLTALIHFNNRTKDISLSLKKKKKIFFLSWTGLDLINIGTILLKRASSINLLFNLD